MAGATVAIMAITTAMQVASTIQQGKAQERAYAAQAGIDEQNAQRTALETSMNEDTLRKQNRQRLAQIAGAQAEAGLVGATAEKSYLTSFANAEQDALNLRYSGMSQWQNYKNSAMLNRAYGRQARKNALQSAYIQGFSGAARTLAWGGEKGVFGQKVAGYFKGA